MASPICGCGRTSMPSPVRNSEGIAGGPHTQEVIGRLGILPVALYAAVLHQPARPRRLRQTATATLFGRSFARTAASIAKDTQVMASTWSGSHFARPKPLPAETLPGLPRPPAIPVHAATHRRRTGSGRSRGSDGSGLDIVDRKGGLLSPQPVILRVRDDGPRHRCARQMAKLACRHQASFTSAMSLRRQEGRLLIRDLRSARLLYAQIECTVPYADLHEATLG